MVGRAWADVLMALEVLNRPLVLFRCGSGLERSKIAPLSRPGIYLPGIQAVLAASKLPYHGQAPAAMACS